jgi:hypothetical protein
MCAKGNKPSKANTTKSKITQRLIYGKTVTPDPDEGRIQIAKRKPEVKITDGVVLKHNKITIIWIRLDVIDQ